ncbi:MAG: amidase domain-containing protein [Candidatus Delongbacteria bacterium]|jgi:hypothetical protein|nr:amidase domain-containing protein [Candidatus Delongbacteria bacterium]
MKNKANDTREEKITNQTGGTKMKKLLITILLLMLLFPILAMSKGNDANIVKYTQKQENFLRRIATLQKNNKEIPKRGSTSWIQYVFKDDLTRLYLVNSFLEHGENSLKINTLMYHMSYVNKFENEFPVTYTDILGNKHIFTKEGSIGQLKKLFKSNDPSIQISSCRALAGLEYMDDEIFTLLKYYATGTNIDNWDITNGARYINGITGGSKKEWENPSKEKLDQCREDMQAMATGALHKINDEKYEYEIKELFNNLLSKNPSGRLKKRLQRYLKKFENNKDGSFNYFENSKSIKLSKEYLAIWKPDSSKSYCEQWWGPEEGDDYNNADYKIAYYNSDEADCANFGSQCLIAGGFDLSNTSATGIITNHPCGETTIVNCDDLNTFLTAEIDDIKSSVIDFSQHPEWQDDPHGQIPSWFRTGDIALMGQSGGDNWQHTIINHEGNGINTRFGCHSEPQIGKTLNTGGWIDYIGGESPFNYITFYHVIGSTALVEPSEDNITVSLGDTLSLKAIVTNNTEPTSLNPITGFKFILKKKPANTVETLFTTTNQPTAADSTYIFDFETASQDTGLYVLIAETTYSEGTTIDSCFLKIKAVPKIISPLPDSLYFVEPSEKGAITDTLEVKVEVPQLVGGYPEIKIKIDDVYVDQGDIVFEDSLWVYYWDLSTLSTTEITGKRHSIKAEILGDPNCNTTSGAMIVEVILHEDFEEITDLTAEGWTVTSYEFPPITYTGWYIGNDPTGVEGKCAKSLSTYSTTIGYKLFTPAFTVPDSSLNKTKLANRIYFKKMDDPATFSFLYFDVCDASGNPLGETEMLNTANREWLDFNYDLSPYSGQTIKLRWHHNYNNPASSCNSTTYALDDIIVYAIPDMDSPDIDFVFGNSAFVDEDMILNLEFNDESDISSAVADYTIEGDSGTITLTPTKDSYNYTGTILARNHECNGDIVFTIEDIVGNEIISDTYSITWSGTSSILTAPENVQITMENDSTVTLDWDTVVEASEYKIYVSEDPYGGFTLDTLGTFTASTQWQKSVEIDKKFYYIVAANTSKMIIDEKDIEYDKLIWRDEEILELPEIKEDKEKTK